MTHQLSKINYTLLAMSFVILMVNVEYTGIAIIIPIMSKTLKLTLSQIQWSATIYLFAFVAMNIGGGQLGDLFGSKKILMTGLIIFTLASLLGGLAQNAWQMLAARLLQGLGGALMWPNTTAIAFNSVAAEKKAYAIGVITGVVGFSMAIGPPLAGYLATILSWRWFFLINVPFGIALLIYLFTLRSAPHPIRQAKLDIQGLVLLILTLILLLITIDFIKTIDQDFIYLILTLLGTIALFFLFIWTEKRVEHPLLDMELFKNNRFLIGCGVRGLNNFSFYILLFVMGLYLHQGLGYSTLASGMFFLPMMVLIGLSSPIGGKVIGKIGPLKPVIYGLALFIISYISFAVIGTKTPAWLLVSLFILPGLAYGLVSPGLLTMTMQSVSPQKAGVASGAFYMSSVLGSLIGASGAGVILSHYQSSSLTQTLLSGLPAVMFMCTLSIGVGLLILAVFRHSLSQKT